MEVTVGMENLSMLTISKPLSASKIRTYHEREFASQEQKYHNF